MDKINGGIYMKKFIGVFSVLFFAMAIVPFVSIDAEAAQLDVSSVFDAQYYYTHNDDLQIAGITSEQDLLNHYLTYGINEYRLTSPDFYIGRKDLIAQISGYILDSNNSHVLQIKSRSGVGKSSTLALLV